MLCMNERFDVNIGCEDILPLKCQAKFVVFIFSVFRENKVLSYHVNCLPILSNK